MLGFYKELVRYLESVMEMTQKIIFCLGISTTANVTRVLMENVSTLEESNIPVFIVENTTEDDSVSVFLSSVWRGNQKKMLKTHMILLVFDFYQTLK